MQQHEVTVEVEDGFPWPMPFCMQVAGEMVPQFEEMAGNRVAIVSTWFFCRDGMLLMAMLEDESTCISLCKLHADKLHTRAPGVDVRVEQLPFEDWTRYFAPTH